MTNKHDYIAGSIWGLIVGDALGVPVEFNSREYLKENPVTDMMAYGTHNQPKGTWSDDSSMMLCTLDSLCKGEIDYDDIMLKFSKCMFKGDYTAHGEVFDCGSTTYEAICRYMNSTPPLECGSRGEYDNGNGSLMRILPVVLYQFEKYKHFMHNMRHAIFQPISAVSGLTHAHSTSVLGCEIYAQYLGTVIRYKLGENHGDIYDEFNQVYSSAWNDYAYNGYGNVFEDDNYREAIEKYSRLKDTRAFAALPEGEIHSGCYVVTTLEAALWCFLNTDSYKDCVLKAVNLGRDTDTVAAVAGSIAGAYYGVDSIPSEWLDCLARKEWIAGIIDKFETATSQLASR